MRLSLVAALILCCSGVAANFTTEFDRAKAFQQAGKLSDARSAFQVLLRDRGLAPAERAKTLLELSRTDMSEGRYPEAISYGERAHSIFQKLSDPVSDGNL